MVQRVRVTRLDIILMLMLVVAGASVWPITSAFVKGYRQHSAPRELNYHTQHGVHALRVRLKGLEDELGKIREKVVEKRLDSAVAGAELSRVQKIASDYEASVVETTLTVATAESAAARAYQWDQQKHEWQTLGVTMSLSAVVNIVLLGLFWFFADPLFGLAGLTPTWSRVLPVSGAAILVAMGYQAGHVSGLLALMLLVTVVGAGWLLMTSMRQPAQTVRP